MHVVLPPPRCRRYLARRSQCFLARKQHDSEHTDRLQQRLDTIRREKMDFADRADQAIVGLGGQVFIGGGSAGTAGGVKVTTACVLLASRLAAARGLIPTGSRKPTCVLWAPAPPWVQAPWCRRTSSRTA